MRLPTTRGLIIAEWLMLTFIAAIPWLVLMGSENLPIYFSKYNMVFTISILVILLFFAVVAILIDTLKATKILLIASCVGFIFGLARVILLYSINADFSDYCFGLFIRIFSLSCCDAASGCSDEIFLLTFFVVLVIGTARLVKSKYYSTSKT